MYLVYKQITMGQANVKTAGNLQSIYQIKCLVRQQKYIQNGFIFSYLIRKHRKREKQRERKVVQQIIVASLSTSSLTEIYIEFSDKNMFALVL